jgi:tetratricopeptide (TPR) repeat protein
MLQYHQGVALKESGKLPEARKLFDDVVKNHAKTPEAVEAGLRYGQALKDEAAKQIAAAKQLLSQGGRKPEQVAEDRKKFDDGVKMLADAVKYLEARAEALKTQKPEATARARMLYDAAWAARAMAELEIESAREKLRQEKWQQRKDDIAKKLQPKQKMPFVPAPEITPAMIPQQESEKKVRALYQALITAFPDLEQNTDARFEYAELLSEREEYDAAIKMLQEALDKEPPAELTDRIRIRLGFCMSAKGDHKAAMAQFAPIAKNEKSPHRAQAA